MRDFGYRPGHKLILCPPSANRPGINKQNEGRCDPFYDKVVNVSEIRNDDSASIRLKETGDIWWWQGFFKPIWVETEVGSELMKNVTL